MNWDDKENDRLRRAAERDAAVPKWKRDALGAIAGADLARMGRFREWSKTKNAADIASLLWCAEYRRNELEGKTYAWLL